jgi:hypothetical protein
MDEIAIIYAQGEILRAKGMSVVIGEGQCVACYKKLEKTKCKAIVISH